MSRRWMIVLVCGAMLAAVPASAASRAGKFAIKDAGLIPCTVYIKEQKNASKAYFQFMGWVMGYISAHNRFSEDTVDVAPWQSTGLLGAMIGNFCRANGKARLAAATVRLIAALHPTRLRSASKKIKTSAGERNVYIYEAILRRAQQMLTERGHFTGAVNGKFGPETAKAFEAFQKQKKLKVTGLPDQKTLLLLFQ